MKTLVNVVRFALLCLVALLLVSVVVGIAADETGAVEKVVLAVGALLLVLVSGRVRRPGRPQPS